MNIYKHLDTVESISQLDNLTNLDVMTPPVNEQVQSCNVIPVSIMRVLDETYLETLRPLVVR